MGKSCRLTVENKAMLLQIAVLQTRLEGIPLSAHSGLIEREMQSTAHAMKIRQSWSMLLGSEASKCGLENDGSLSQTNEDAAQGRARK